MSPDLAERHITRFDGAWRFLSNFYRCPVTMDDGLTYPTAEHAFQAQKSDKFSERAKILRCKTPADAKAMGRKILIVDGWDLARKRIMWDVVMAKFWQNAELQRWLGGTGSAVLTEGNSWHDNYWGSCCCGRADRCSQPGRNYLGQILMAVRMVLSDDAAPRLDRIEKHPGI